MGDGHLSEGRDTVLSRFEADNGNRQPHLLQHPPEVEHDFLGGVGIEKDESVSVSVLDEDVATKPVDEVNTAESYFVFDEVFLVRQQSVGALLGIEAAVVEQEVIEVVYRLATGFNGMADETTVVVVLVTLGVGRDYLF